MGQFPQDGKYGQNVAFFYFFGALLWLNGFIFSTLVLAHLEPELEMFEVDDIGDDTGDDDF